MQIKRWRDWSPEARWWSIVGPMFLGLVIYDEWQLFFNHDVEGFEFLLGLMITLAYSMYQFNRVEMPKLGTPLLPLMWRVLISPILLGVSIVLIVDSWVR